MNPDTLDQAIETEQPFEAAEQTYIERLYLLLENQDLLNDHEHTMAHRILDVITAIKQLHYDIDNPPTSKSKSSFFEFFDSIAKSGNSPFAKIFEKGES